MLAPAPVKNFTEFLVEWERCGCVRSFDSWIECRDHIRERLEANGFEPFYVACVKYRGRNFMTAWDFEWTDDSMVARGSDRDYFREVGIWDLVRGLFRMEWCNAGF